MIDPHLLRAARDQDGLLVDVEQFHISEADKVQMVLSGSPPQELIDWLADHRLTLLAEYGKWRIESICD